MKVTMGVSLEYIILFKTPKLPEYVYLKIYSSS
jgi:hypothetical protein